MVGFGLAPDLEAYAEGLAEDEALFQAKELERFRAEDGRIAMTYKAIMGNALEAELEQGSKKETIKLLLAMGNLSKLYFIVRSGIMKLISGLVFLIATLRWEP